MRRREGLDVPPLPLGVERVKRQRALPRAADAGHDDQPVERQVEVDPLRLWVLTWRSRMVEAGGAKDIR